MKRREAIKKTTLLGGTAVLSTSLLALWQSCKSAPRLDWQPQFLNTDHAQLVSALVDTLLPKTDTPGGLEVKVDMLVDLIYAKTVDEEGQKNIVSEMDAFNDKCISRFGKVFHELDRDQRNSIIQEEETSAPKFGRGVWGLTVEDNGPVGFYRSFKSMAIWGYCTSEEIGMNQLNYDPVPGDYKGCVPLAEVGKVWSL